MVGIPESVILDGNEAAYMAGVARRIAANARKTHLKRIETDSDYAAMVSFVERKFENDRSGQSFFSSVWKSVEKNGKFTDKQEETCFRIMREDEAKRKKMRAADAGSNFVGTEKERLSLSLTITGYKHTEASEFFSESYFHAMKDDAGNVFVYSGSVKLGEKGSRFEGKATINRHYEKDGVKTNYLSRPKAA